MKTVARTFFFVVIVVISALGLLGLLPFAKEGFSRDLIPTLISGALAFVTLGALWWWAVGRDLLKAILGWFVLAIPSIAYLMAATALVLAMISGDRLSSQAVIENFREEPILWDGFEGPVGWRISFDLLHPEDASGLIVPPEIRMGPAVEIPTAEISATRTSGSGTFKDSYLDEEVGPLSRLKTVLFQRAYKNPQAKQSKAMKPGPLPTASMRADGRRWSITFTQVWSTISKTPNASASAPGRPGSPSAAPSSAPRTAAGSRAAAAQLT
jgi:hypothetical protein